MSDGDDILQDATEVRVAPGEIAYRTNELTLVVSGLIRVYRLSSHGRQITVRYATAGELVGLPFLLAPAAFAHVPPQTVTTLTECHLVRLSTHRFREVANRTSTNMWPLFHELASLHQGYIDMLAENLFLPVRPRVARHLLDLAIHEGGQATVRASQQQIADAIGSVREVVSRALVWMRDEQILHRTTASYVIDDPARLIAVAHGCDVDRAIVGAPSRRAW